MVSIRHFTFNFVLVQTLEQVLTLITETKKELSRGHNGPISGSKIAHIFMNELNTI